MKDFVDRKGNLMQLTAFLPYFYFQSVNNIAYKRNSPKLEKYGLLFYRFMMSILLTNTL